MAAVGVEVSRRVDWALHRTRSRVAMLGDGGRGTVNDCMRDGSRDEETIVVNYGEGVVAVSGDGLTMRTRTRRLDDGR